MSVAFEEVAGLREVISEVCSVCLSKRRQWWFSVDHTGQLNIPTLPKSMLFKCGSERQYYGHST